MNRISAALLAFGLAFQVGIAYASPEICSSTSACEYTGPNAPDWGSDVCWSSSAETMFPPDVAGGCPSGHSLYYAEHAEIVNEVYGDMIAYYEVSTDACDVPGICVEGPPPSGAETQLICCNAWGLCFPLADVLCNNRGDQRLICYNGVSNLDGSVTCFEGQPY